LSKQKRLPPHRHSEKIAPMTSLCWLRRDLRLHDNAALSAALEHGPTHLCFVFDTHILNKLKNKSDQRISFIIDSLYEIHETLKLHGSGLHILYGKPEEEIPKLAKNLSVDTVFANRDYEPYAKARDAKVSSLVNLKTFKDSVIFEFNEVKKNDGTPYKVFTPYKNQWLWVLSETANNLPDYKCPLKNLAKVTVPEVNCFELTGFEKVPTSLSAGTKAALKRLKDFRARMPDYKTNRDFPAIEGTSYLSPSIRFGTISIRDMVRNSLSQTWLSELIWRDFYQMILDQFPHVASGPFRPEYGEIKWIGNKSHFEKWVQGETGFPLVDAAMRCFAQTGLMHNRLRMVVASFLCKTLLLDWQDGEKYFAEQLLDFDLAANNGGWQWSSSSGCDAQPYFRIFNPYNQSQKFDPDGEFISKWVPELSHLKGKDIHRPLKMLAPDYIDPIVDYETNRHRCLQMYSVVKKK